MKPFNFSSPYSRLGIAFALVSCLGVFLFNLAQPEPNARVLFSTDAFQRNSNLPWKLIEPPHLDFGEFNLRNDDIPNFREASRFFDDEAISPCFTVWIDETIPGAAKDAVSGRFGNSDLTIGTEAFTEGLKKRMADDFSAEAWARDRNCFDGSFVVSFTVTEEGRLGDSALVHHLRGQSNSAGISVLDVLRSLDREGVRWHDGTQGAGEVRIPVKFKLG